MITYLLAWFPMLVIAFINGTLRDLWYKQYVGELTAHQISTITVLVFFAIYIRFIIKKYPPASSIQCIYIGLLWLLLTLLFEFGFGIMRGNSWQKLLSDYNILQGKWWALVPVWIAIAPWLFYRFGK